MFTVAWKMLLQSLSLSVRARSVLECAVTIDTLTDRRCVAQQKGKRFLAVSLLGFTRRYAELERSSHGERDAVTHKITKPTTLYYLPETRDHATYWTLSGEPVPWQRLLPERVRSDVSVIPTLAATWGSLSCAATRPRCLLSLLRSLPYALEVTYHNGAMLIHTGERIIRKVDQPVSLG